MFTIIKNAFTALNRVAETVEILEINKSSLYQDQYDFYRQLKKDIRLNISKNALDIMNSNFNSIKIIPYKEHDTFNKWVFDDYRGIKVTISPLAENAKIEFYNFKNRNLTAIMYITLLES